MKIITINLPEKYLEAIQTLNDLGIYPSRSEAIRTALSEFLDEEFHQGRRTPGSIDHIIGRVPRCKTPQPVRLAIDPPARFVGMQMGGLLRLLADLFVPGFEHIRQSVPSVDQTARR